MTKFVCQRCLHRLSTTRRLSTARLAGRSWNSTSLFQHGRHWRSYSTNPGARPLRLAVIGSGPAGFYSSYRVLSRLQNAVVDMYEALPVPYGLVRYGVAPDHPEVKNCQDKFEEVAQSPRFNFIANIAIGHDIPLASLKPHYDAILFAYGASEDRALGIPGEDLKGVYSARAFVGWYNGLPQYSDLSPDLSGKEAVIVGQGNVALDVARILLSDLDVLRKTDIAEHAVQALSESKVSNVRVVGRRGLLQAAFTIKELRELLTLSNTSFTPLPSSPGFLPTPEERKKFPRPQKRIVELTQKHSDANATAESPKEKSWALEFLLSPITFNGTDHISSATFAKNQYAPSSDPLSRSAKVRPTGEQVELPASLAFRSVGYKSVPLPGLSDLGILFDEKMGIIPNDVHGRVLRPLDSAVAEADGSELMANAVPGLYAAGWVKRGPTGVIASTMDDAFSTGDVIAQDWENSVPFLSGDGVKGGWEEVRKLARDKGLREVTWNDWKAIDHEEKRRGQLNDKEREKIVKVEEMLKVLDG